MVTVVKAVQYFIFTKESNLSTLLLNASIKLQKEVLARYIAVNQMTEVL